MNAAALEQIVNAVLYEGYVLYPYRPSSKKNRRERFTFGRVYPENFSRLQNGLEPFVIQTECLVRKTESSAALNVSLGFLHPMAREIGKFPTPLREYSEHQAQELQFVPELQIGGQLFQAWHEAVERKVAAPALTLEGDSPIRVTFPFRFFGSRELEPIRDSQGFTAGMIVRRQETVEGSVKISIESLDSDLRKIQVRVLNQTPVAEAEANDREMVLMRTFASTHAVLTVRGADFISLMDPAAEYKSAASACKNIGTWPVLVGDETKRERDTMLSSPIILYDYPKIAPESAGSLFDGTEIDEILTLRILTMTDDEKLEMGRIDEHARRLLERTETLSEDALLRMHGTMRKPQADAPVEFDDFFGGKARLTGVSVDGVYLQAGDRVRLRPKARADVMDIALSGQTAVIEAVEQDLEQRIHLAVVLENDPGKDLGLLRQPGHRFFYGVDEVEPLKEAPR